MDRGGVLREVPSNRPLHTAPTPSWAAKNWRVPLAEYVKKLKNLRKSENFFYDPLEAYTNPHR